jgi:hypothetical protein
MVHLAFVDAFFSGKVVDLSHCAVFVERRAFE